MVNGKRMTVKGNTAEEYEINARATKAGLIASKDEPPKLALGDIIDSYIASNEHVLSPSTIRGYATIRAKHSLAEDGEQRDIPAFTKDREKCVGTRVSKSCCC